MTDERLTPREAAKLIGVCPRRLLTEFVRLGWLPYPDETDGRWSRGDVEMVLQRFKHRENA